MTIPCKSHWHEEQAGNSICNGLVQRKHTLFSYHVLHTGYIYANRHCIDKAVQRPSNISRYFFEFNFLANYVPGVTLQCP